MEIYFKDPYTGTVLLPSLITFKKKTKKKQIVSLPLKSYSKPNEILIALKRSLYSTL